MTAAAQVKREIMWEFPGGATKLKGSWHSHVVSVMKGRLELNLSKFCQLSSKKDVHQMVAQLAELVISRATFRPSAIEIEGALTAWFLYGLELYAPTYRKYQPLLVELIIACSEQRMSLSV
jgi:hypothetical protein